MGPILSHLFVLNLKIFIFFLQKRFKRENLPFESMGPIFMIQTVQTL